MTVTAPQYLNGATYSGDVVRRHYVDSAGIYEGVYCPGDCWVAPGTGMTVTVGTGRVYVQGDTISGQGVYSAEITAPETVTIAAADASLARYDLIVARVYEDAIDGSGRTELAIEAVTGTPGVFTAPAPPDTAIILAELRVLAAATSFTTADIERVDIGRYRIAQTYQQQSICSNIDNMMRMGDISGGTLTPLFPEVEAGSGLATGGVFNRTPMAGVVLPGSQTSWDVGRSTNNTIRAILPRAVYGMTEAIFTSPISGVTSGNHDLEINAYLGNALIAWGGSTETVWDPATVFTGSATDIPAGPVQMDWGANTIVYSGSYAPASDFTYPQAGSTTLPIVGVR